MPSKHLQTLKRGMSRSFGERRNVDTSASTVVVTGWEGVCSGGFWSIVEDLVASSRENESFGLMGSEEKM